MNFSDRINRVEESLTIGMAKKAREFKDLGKDVISLSLGEPDFDTPNHIKEAAIQAINDGKTKYTPVGGIPELKKAICDKLARDYKIKYAANEVMVSNGAKQCIMNLMQCLIQEGDEVLIPLPYWVSYSAMAEYSGGKCVYIPSKFEEGFALDLDVLEQSITPRTKVILFSSPNNPAGSMLSKEQLSKMAGIVAKHPQITVISDEIYEHLVFEEKHESISQFEEIRDQVVIVNGVSKGFAMTGWRIGWMAGPAAIIKKCDVLQGQFTSGANSIAQWASAAALNSDLKPTYEMVEVYKQRREMMRELLGEIEGMELDQPKGAYYLFPRVSHFFGKTLNGVLIKDSLDLSMYILEQGLVSTVPGVAFGMNDHIRISYANSEAELREAAKRMKEVLSL
ncbi:MAG: pyridoxal phosphate-dependent aminotransferase [Bacteroidetes bacterium]|jgi:aspartate aminotransferase|nr:pyridoxal phosphate-dependent aminotransferase [Bacteroidota bacterium]MDA8930627.1 pyridoxal phosphate-dependent aminotransferase [Bacteroidia bacterium]